MLWSPAYVAVGSNLNQPARQVSRALTALAELPHTRVEVASPLFGSKPFGLISQPDFVNAVAGVLTQLELKPFFDALLELERRLGKQAPPVRWGPRLIDLDLLLFAQQRIESPELTLPHPGIVQRNFVLYPLREVAPELIVPGSGRVSMLASRIESAGIWRLDDETITHDA